MIRSFLNKPFPGAAFCLSSFLKYFLVGLFVALFLLVFQPFEINLWETPHKTLKIMGYGAVSFLAPSLYSLLLSLLIPRHITEDRWTIGKEILSITLVLMLIAAGNLLYSHAIGIACVSFLNFINALIPVLLLGIFPVSFLVASRHNQLFKRNAKEAEAITEQLHAPAHLQVEPTTKQLILMAENGKDQLELNPLDLLYIESADNYSNVVYLDNGQTKRQLIRSSLKRLESQIDQPYIVRCHRTYIVNLKKVDKVEGNAAGYKLNLTPVTEPIPVSRNFGPAVTAQLRSMN